MSKLFRMALETAVDEIQIPATDEVVVDTSADLTEEEQALIGVLPEQEPVVDDAAGVVVADAEVVEPIIDAEDTAVLDETGEEGDEFLEEAEDTSNDTETLLDEVNQADDAAVALESIANHLQSGLKNGGLSGREVKLARMFVNHVRGNMRLGDSVGFMGMESVSSADDLRGVAMEAIADAKETAKQIWAAIIEGVKKVFEWLKSFAQSTLAFLGNVEARAKKLIEVVPTLADKTPKDAIKAGGYLKMLTVGAKFEEAQALSRMQSVISYSQQALQSGKTGLPKVTVALGKVAQGGESSREEFLAAVKAALGGALKPGLVKAEDYGLDGAPEGTQLQTSMVFGGNTVVYAYVPTSSDALAKLRTGTATATAEIALPETVKPLPAAQILVAAKLALQFVKQQAEYKQVQAQINAVTMALGPVMAKATGQAKGDYKALPGNMMAAFRGIRAIIRGVHQPAFAVASKRVGAALDYAVASAKAYGSVEVAASAPAEAAAA